VRRSGPGSLARIAPQVADQATMRSGADPVLQAAADEELVGL
jgi:hypothetical protein